MPTGFILLVAAALAAIAYGSWYYLTLNGRDVGDIVANIPQSIAEIVGMEAATSENSAVPAPKAEETPNTADQAAAAAVEESAPPAESQETSEAAAQSPAPSEPETSAAADTAAENNSGQQAETASPVVAPVTSRPEPAPVRETARESAADSAAPTTAREAPPAQIRGVETTTLPAPATSDTETAADVPEAVQTAVLPDSPPVIVGPEAPSRVMLRATAISWVELRDASGKRVFSRLLKKGETYNVPGSGGITLATGNAGALDVVVDGQTIGPLGPVGAVRRGVPLEPSSLIRRIGRR